MDLKLEPLDQEFLHGDLPLVVVRNTIAIDLAADIKARIVHPCGPSHDLLRLQTPCPLHHVLEIHIEGGETPAIH